MPLELIEGDITQFQESRFQKLVFEDSSASNNNKHESKESKTSYVLLKNEKSGNESKKNEKPLHYSDSIISSVRILKGSAPGYTSISITISITMPKLTEEMFRERYGKYQNIFTVFTGKKDLEIDCKVSFCHKAQFALLCEFIKKYSADFFETFKQLMPDPRQITLQEVVFKRLLQTLSKKTFGSLLSAAQDICKTEQGAYYKGYEAFCYKSWDALWVLGNACLDKKLWQEAYDAFEAIPEGNWYRESADYQITHMLLENIDFTGMDPKKKHQALKDHLTTFFKDFDLKRLVDFGAIAWKLIEFSGCKVTDFGTSGGLKDPFTLLLKLADLHYFLQKDTMFKPEVSYCNLFEKKSITSLNSKDEVTNDNTSEAVFEDWQVEGNLNDFVKNMPNPNSVNSDETKKLRFVNKSTTPHFFTAVELKIQPEFEAVDVNDSQGTPIFSWYRCELQIFLPGTHACSFHKLSELSPKYRAYNDIFQAVHFGDDQSQCYRLVVTAVDQLNEKRVKKFFYFLQNKIPSNICEKLRQCVVARKPTDDEQTFKVGLEKLNSAGKSFAYLLELVQKIRKTGTDGDNEDLFLLGKKCLEVGLVDKAYQAFSCIDRRSYTTQAHFEMSKILLDKIQVNPNVTADENHKTVGEGIVKYRKVSTDKEFYDEDTDLLFEKIKIYAGLSSISTSKQEKSSKQEIVSIIELMLELAERIYLLKENIKQKFEPKKVGLNNNKNNLIVFSESGQQVVNPAQQSTTPSISLTEDTEESSKKTGTNRSSMGK